MLPNITNLANQVLVIKNKALKEKQDTIQATKDKTTPGTVQWFKSLSELDIPHLAQLAASPDFVIVTEEPYKQEAKERFKTPLVLTPKQIKGMEFSVVMAYRPLDAEPAFKDVNKWLAGRPLSPNAQVTIPLNTLFTTFTRPTDTLYITKSTDIIWPMSSTRLKTRLCQVSLLNLKYQAPRLKTIKTNKGNGLIE